MGKFPIISIALIGLIVSPGLALASLQDSFTPLGIISIPNEIQTLKVKFNEKRTINNDNSLEQTLSINNKQIKNKLCSFNKQFGPVGLGLKVNPFNINNSGLTFNIDLMRSFEILSSKPNFTQLTEAFSPAPNQHFINPQILSVLGKTFVSINDKLNSSADLTLKVQ